MLRVTKSVSIAEEELSFTASPSSGPGGQHVNRASTRVTLRFDVANSPSLTQPQKYLIYDRLSTRISKEGILQITSQRHRSQHANKEEVICRFVELLSQALQRPKARTPTKPSKTAKERRLQEKARRAELKRRRSRLTFTSE